VGSGTVSTEVSGNFEVGSSIGDFFFDGRIAEVKVYNVALSADDLNMVMRGYVVRPDKLIADWRLFGTTTDEPDWSGINHHGTVTGTTRIDHPPGIGFPVVVR
jgi:hypothetical protein